MSRNDAPDQDTQQHRPFWQSRAGLALIVFLAAGALLLGYEHRVHILTGNGLLIGLLVACVVMHLFMHGGHGGHGGGRNSNGGGTS